MSHTGILLGMCVNDSQHLMAAISEGVTYEDFTFDWHQELWVRLLEAHRTGAPTDLVAMTVQLPEATRLIVDLATSAPLSGAGHYAAVVRREAWLRRTQRVFSDLAEAAEEAEPTHDTAPFRSRIEEAINKLMATARDSGGIKMADAVLDDAILKLEEDIRQHQAGAKIGVLTGFQTLDTLLGAGWRPGTMTTVAARSGKGKTTWGLNAFSAAIAEHAKAVYFTVEMPNAELVTKLLCRDGLIAAARLRNGDPSDEEIDRLGAVAQRLSRESFGIDDNFGGDVELLCQRVKAHKRLHGLDVVFVDYAQQLFSGDRRKERRQHIEAATARLKQLAIAEKVAIVLIAQVNRIADQEDEIPGPSLIADSAAIEKDSDAIIMLHHFDDGKSVMHLAKNRHGKDDVTIELRCDWNTGHFAERKP